MAYTPFYLFKALKKGGQVWVGSSFEVGRTDRPLDETLKFSHAQADYSNALSTEQCTEISVLVYELALQLQSVYHDHDDTAPFASLPASVFELQEPPRQ